MNSQKNPGTERTPQCQDQVPFLVLSPTISCKWPWTQSAAEPCRSKSCNAFRLVLLLHEQPDMKNDKAAKEVGLSARQVQRWRSRWAAGNSSTEDQPGRGRKPVSPLWIKR